MSGAVRDSGLTGPNPITMTESKDQGVILSSQPTSLQLVARSIQVAEPDSSALGALPRELISRICLFLDRMSFSNLASVSQNMSLVLLGRKVKGILVPESIRSLLGFEDVMEIPETLKYMEGYNLQGRIDQVCAFAQKNIQDLWNQLKSTPLWNNLSPKKRKDLEEIFYITQKSLINELAKCEDLQGADFSRLFHLLNHGEIDATFARPAKGLTEAQKLKVAQVQNACHRFTELLVALIVKVETVILPAYDNHLAVNPDDDDELAFMTIIESLKAHGEQQVENLQIEKALLPASTGFLNFRLRVHESSKQALPYLCTELIQFALTIFPDQERTQLAKTLQDTWPTLKPLIETSMTALINQMYDQEAARLRAAMAAPTLAPPIWGLLSQSWRFVRQSIMITNAFALAYIATPLLLDHLPIDLPPSMGEISTVGMGIALYMGLNRLQPHLNLGTPGEVIAKVIASVVVHSVLSFCAGLTAGSISGDPIDIFKSYTLLGLLVWTFLTYQSFQD